QATANLPAAVAAPGVYVVGTAQANAFNHGDSTPNGPDHPAPVNSLVSIYLTGAGVTSPLLEDGVPAGLPLPALALPVTVEVGGTDAKTVWGGAMGGQMGIAKITFRVPQIAA